MQNKFRFIFISKQKYLRQKAEDTNKGIKSGRPLGSHSSVPLERGVSNISTHVQSRQQIPMSEAVGQRAEQLVTVILDTDRLTLVGERLHRTEIVTIFVYWLVLSRHTVHVGIEVAAA